MSSDPASETARSARHPQKTATTSLLRTALLDPPALVRVATFPPPSLLAAHKLAPWLYSLVRVNEWRPYLMASLGRWAEVAPVADAVLQNLSNHCPVIALRALDYGEGLYSARELRPFNDLDVLVPATDFLRAAEALKALGFTVIHDTRGVAGHQDHYAWQFNGHGLSIDLHRSLRQTVRARVDYAAIFERAKTSKRFGSTVYIPCPEDRVLLHVAHMAAHEFCGPLVAFVDLHFLLASPLERDVLWDRARAFGLQRALNGALQLRLRLLGAPHQPSVWLPSLRRQNDHRYQQPRLLQVARKLSLLDNNSRRLAFLRYALEARSNQDESVNSKNNL